MQRDMKTIALLFALLLPAVASAQSFYGDRLHSGDRQMAT